MVEKITGMLALIGVLSLFCQWLGWKLRLPAILPLLLCGLLLGPAFGVLNPDAIFGDLLFPIISLGVAVILFEGALTLNFKEIKDHGRMVTHLVSIGMVITWGCISTATYYLLNFSWEVALLFGALVVVTGPTVIVPMLRSVRPKSQLASILRWEGIVIDPIGALLAVLVFEYITVSGNQTSHVLYALGSMLTLGLGLGAASGYLIGQVIRHNLLPHYLRNTAVLTLMLGIFVGSNLLQEESGLLTVTVMGIWLANMRGVDIAEILEFKETLTGFKWLAKIKGLTFGYEEALGYAVDAKTVNDKDGISAAITLAQIATDLAADGKTLLDLLDEIWARHGFHATEQISIRLSDLSKVGVILGGLRNNPPQNIAGRAVTSIDDLAAPTDGLPPTDGLRIWLDGGVRIIIRPSGTEAKMKCYVEVIAPDSVSAQKVLDELRSPLQALLTLN